MSKDAFDIYVKAQKVFKLFVASTNTYYEVLTKIELQFVYN